MAGWVVGSRELRGAHEAGKPRTEEPPRSGEGQQGPGVPGEMEGWVRKRQARDTRERCCPQLRGDAEGYRGIPRDDTG